MLDMLFARCQQQKETTELCRESSEFHSDHLTEKGVQKNPSDIKYAAQGAATGRLVGCNPTLQMK